LNLPDDQLITRILPDLLPGNSFVFSHLSSRQKEGL